MQCTYKYIPAIDRSVTRGVNFVDNLVQKMDNNERRETAYHEAAHAVHYYWSDVPFRKVTIKPDGDSLGHVALHQSPRWKYDPATPAEEKRARWRIEAEVIGGFAGQLAQARLTGKHPEDGHWKDDQDAVTLAIRLFGGGGDVVDVYLHFCFLRAQGFVNTRPRWVEIEALAEALLERETLTKEQVRQVIANIPLDRF
jgi:hypothetical protein